MCELILSLFLSADVNFEELSRCTDDFNGAQCKAVCVEAVSVSLQINTRYCSSRQNDLNETS